MHIAITGASGGLGREVVRQALAAGHGVVAIDQTPPTEPSAARFVQADATDYHALAAAITDCDALIHLAAIAAPGEHPDHIIHNTNVMASYNALHAAAEQGIRRICQASSVNAIGMSYSRAPRYNYFPLDEAHPSYNEEPYSLSKWICEQQADSLVRRYPGLTIASLRFHWIVPERAYAVDIRHGGDDDSLAHPQHLWAYVRRDASAHACLLTLTAPLSGHEVFFIAAPDTTLSTLSANLAQQHYPTVPGGTDLIGNQSFISSAKAERLLGWRHPPGP